MYLSHLYNVHTKYQNKTQLMGHKMRLSTEVTCEMSKTYMRLIDALVTVS